MIGPGWHTRATRRCATIAEAPVRAPFPPGRNRVRTGITITPTAVSFGGPCGQVAR